MPARAGYKLAGARGLAQGAVLAREPERSLGIVPDREPEFGGVIGERVRVPREQLVVAGLHLAAPGLVSSAWPVSDRMRASCVA